MLKYDPPTATTTPVRQVTGLGFASDLPAASPPPLPSVTDCAALLRLAQAAADRVEGSVGDLDGTLCEFAADDVCPTRFGTPPPTHRRFWRSLARTFWRRSRV